MSTLEQEDKMFVELTRTRTRDGIWLDGALLQPDSPTPSSSPVDGVICLHGVGSNFYGSSLIGQLAQALRQQGLCVLRINTRGHDGVSTATTDQGGRLQGAAYEIVDECRFDVQAWVGFLRERGCTRIALLGHSLGAIKVVYAQALEPHEDVTSLIAISPPRLCYSRFLRGNDAAAFRSSFATAQQWVEEKQPQMLFQATFPFPLVISAATFLDKYGPAERYDFLKLSERLSTPVHFVYGQRELDAGGSAFDGIATDVEKSAWPPGSSLKVIPHANHFYHGCVPALIEVVTQSLGEGPVLPGLGDMVD